MCRLKNANTLHLLRSADAIVLGVPVVVTVAAAHCVLQKEHTFAATVKVVVVDILSSVERFETGFLKSITYNETVTTTHTVIALHEDSNKNVSILL